MYFRHLISTSLYIGIVSGLLMGLFLKLIESITGFLVYTLLLNVDFLPLLGRFNWIEPIEFLFHLLVSIFIAFIFIYFVETMHIGSNFPKSLFLSFIICLPTFSSYFVLSGLAIKDVPKWNDWLAFAYWCMAHLFYMWMLPVLYKKL